MKFFSALIILLLLFIFISNRAFGQIRDTLYPDDQYFKCLQFTDPGFYVPHDSIQLLQTLHKQHSVIKALAREAVRLGLDTLPDVRAELTLIQDLVRNRYLAQLMNRYANDMVFEVSDSEVYDYYKNNISVFSEMGKVSYIRVMYKKPQDETRARAEVSKYQKNLPRSWSQITKMDADGIVLTSDFDIPLNNQQPFTKYLEGKKKGDLIGPFRYQDQYVFLLVLDIVPTKPVPIKEVYEMCRSMLLNEKKSKWFIEFEERAKKEFPVILENIKFNYK